MPWTPKASGGLKRNRLSALACWKIFDNLRRSLEPAAFLIMLLWGWFGASEPVSWTLAVLMLVLIQPLCSALQELMHKTVDVPIEQHLAAALHTCSQHFTRALLPLVWLPYETWYSLDAIGRTLWRMLLSKRRLLQWQPSREVERGHGHSLAGQYRSMWIAPLLALMLLALLQLPALLSAGPFILMWLASPAIAWWLSRPSRRAEFHPSSTELRFLQTLARRTWAFFDQYVGPADNWLPPDNIQEQPLFAVAHRTSPTNMGMALLSHLAAHDFGYLSSGRLLQRLEQSLASMAQLERYRGHFYNWYDTLTCKPLPPLYVSTVDSGNLAGLLLTLRPGLLTLADAPRHDLRLASGLVDTLDVLQDALNTAGLDSREIEVLSLQARAMQHRLSHSANGSSAQLLSLLEQISAHGANSALEGDAEVLFWRAELAAQCLDLRSELERFVLPAQQDGSNLPPLSWRQLAELDLSLWVPEQQPRVSAVRALASQRLATLEQLTDQISDLARMDFGFLYDRQRNLFVIGYNADERKLDAGYYDLLASEARLTNFVVIAQGQLPQEGWFSLGRLLTSNGGMPVLLSWSGSMFEYLMPMLVMPNYEGTLLDQTCRAAVALQIEHGKQLGIPWGCPSRATTPWMPSSTISTGPSAFPAWASSAAWAKTAWSRPTPACWR